MRKLITNNILLIPLFILIGCQEQLTNSNTSDDKLGGEICESTLSAADMRFCKAKNVIIKRCISCHTNYHSVYSTYTESDFNTENVITPGDATNSSLISILINNGGNMPKGGKPIPSDEITVLEDWINNFVP